MDLPIAVFHPNPRHRVGDLTPISTPYDFLFERSIVFETFAINLGEKMAENLAENLISAYNVQL